MLCFSIFRMGSRTVKQVLMIYHSQRIWSLKYLINELWKKLFLSKSLQKELPDKQTEKWQKNNWLENWKIFCQLWKSRRILRWNWPTGFTNKKFKVQVQPAKRSHLNGCIKGWGMGFLGATIICGIFWNTPPISVFKVLYPLFLLLILAGMVAGTIIGLKRAKGGGK